LAILNAEIKEDNNSNLPKPPEPIKERVLWVIKTKTTHISSARGRVVNAATWVVNGYNYIRN
jgi:hypothetical protein